MAEMIKLAAEELLPERPFTNPEHSRNDLARMIHMAQQLVDTYDDPVFCDFNRTNKAICQSDPQGRHFRIYYVQPQRLFSQKQIAVVGFFGYMRPKADVRPLIQADKQFEAEFHKHPGLLSLSTVRLPDGNFANLVLFSDFNSIDLWNYSKLHHELVRKISPPYYEAVRLNNGLLPDGLASPDTLRLLRIKYLDFKTDPPWRGLRQLEET